MAANKRLELLIPASEAGVLPITPTRDILLDGTSRETRTLTPFQDMGS